jgi:uncharacterized membrane protein
MKYRKIIAYCVPVVALAIGSYIGLEDTTELENGLNALIAAVFGLLGILGVVKNHGDH